MKERSEKALWNLTKSSDKTKIAITIMIAVILLLGVLAAVAVGMNHRLKKADAYVTQGNQYYVESEYDQAEQCYKKAIALKKKDANAYLLLSKTYLAQDDFDSAIAILESGYKATKDATIEQEISNLKSTEIKSSNQAYSAAVGTTASEDAVAFGQSETALANSRSPNTPGEQVQSAVNVPQVDADTLEKFAAQTEQTDAEESSEGSSNSPAVTKTSPMVTEVSPVVAETSQANSIENVKQVVGATASEISRVDAQAEIATSAEAVQSSIVTCVATTTAQNSQSTQIANHMTSQTTTYLEITESETELTTQTTMAFFEKPEDGVYVYTDMEGKKHQISANHVELLHNFWKHLQIETTVTTESTADEQTATETVTMAASKTTDTTQEKTTQTTAVTTELIAEPPTYEKEFDDWLENLIYALFLRNIIS